MSLLSDLGGLVWVLGLCQWKLRWAPELSSIAGSPVGEPIPGVGQGLGCPMWPHKWEGGGPSVED